MCLMCISNGDVAAAARPPPAPPAPPPSPANATGGSPAAAARPKPRSPSPDPSSSSSGTCCPTPPPGTPTSASATTRHAPTPTGRSVTTSARSRPSASRSPSPRPPDPYHPDQARSPRQARVRARPADVSYFPVSLWTCVRCRSAWSVTWGCCLVRSSADALEPRRMRPELRPARPPSVKVFKSIGEALPGSVASWAFRGCARSGTQDHPCISRAPFGALAACWPPSICSVAVGGLSRTVQRRPSAGPMFQPCHSRR